MATEVSAMPSCLALPREGHLEQLFHIFSYLKNNHNSEMVFGPTIPDIDFDQFPKKGWAGAPCSKGDGAGLKEEKPPNAPRARGAGFIARMLVDSDHAGDKVTRRSRTGFLVYCNNALIYWHSKKQASIEASSFGSELMAMKRGAEHARGLRYKLRMMGIPAELPAFAYAGSKPAIASSSVPEPTLKKKSNSIAYNFVREGCAADEWRITYISASSNPSGLVAKCLAPGEKREKFVGMLVCYVSSVVTKNVVRWKETIAQYWG